MLRRYCPLSSLCCYIPANLLDANDLNLQIKLDKSGRAVGVWYVRHGVKRFARAGKEIIVSGGVVDSPKLLMLSGIGPKEHLKSVGVGNFCCSPICSDSRNV